MKLTLLALVLLCGCDADKTFARMMNQPRVDAFEDARTPPRGTVPRGRAAEPPYRDLDRIPIPVTRDLLARGRERFEIFCAACHGIRGDAKTVVADAMEIRKPPTLHEPRIRALPPGRIYAVVREGYGLMPSFASEIPSVEERWAVVAYVRALWLAAGVPLAELPPELREEARRELE